MRRLFFSLLAVVAVPALSAQSAFDWYGRGPYRPAVPRPDSLLGHELGSRQTMYHEQQRVLDRLIAAAPDRVRTEVIGATAEGKVMRLLSGSIWAAVENVGRGKVVLFAEDPLFRAFWRGPAGLLNNAILMAPGR